MSDPDRPSAPGTATTDSDRPAVIVYIAASLDGFIAREDGGVDWLDGYHGGGEDYGYGAFISTIDTLVIGRNTFEKMMTFDFWPYEEKRVVVLSSGRPDIPSKLLTQIEVLDMQPAVLLTHLADTGTRRIYLDGGRTIQRFLRAGLVDELILTHVPVLLGSGIPLFGELPQDVELDHIRTESFDTGLVQSTYRPRRG